MRRRKKERQCKRHADCFANKSGECLILVNTDFGKRECPFYKTSEQLKAERMSREER